MPSKLTLRMLLAATLAALQLSASGAPLEDTRTDGPAEVEASGEEQREERKESCNKTEGLNPFRIWKLAIAPTERHKKEFEKEFQDNVNFNSLTCTHPSFPVKCPSPISNKEACLQRLAEGLLTYKVLLKHVEKEYPNISIGTEVRDRATHLINIIKAKMRRCERVKAMTYSEEQQLLKEFDNPDDLTRKKSAHSILCSLRFFLIEGEKSFRQCETPRKQAARAKTTN